LTALGSRNASDLIPFPRCCSSHADWKTLAEHLAADFPDAAPTKVVQAISQARAAMDLAGMTGDDALDTGEVLARQHLMLVTGRLEEAARLDSTSR
jgi:hypothetical protein